VRLVLIEVIAVRGAVPHRAWGRLVLAGPFFLSMGKTNTQPVAAMQQARALRQARKQQKKGKRTGLNRTQIGAC